MKLYLAVCLFVATPAFAAAPNSYAEALSRAEEEGRDLLLTIGSGDAGAHEKTIRNSLSTSNRPPVYVHIDQNAHPELAEKLKRGDAVPQTVLYRKDDDKWLRWSRAGEMSLRDAAKWTGGKAPELSMYHGSLQDRAQAKANEMARRQLMSHGVGPTLGRFEGVGCSASTPNCSTCSTSGTPRADAVARGANGWWYRIRVW